MLIVPMISLFIWRAHDLMYRNVSEFTRVSVNFERNAQSSILYALFSTKTVSAS
jgi:hypothetical protein